MSLASDPVKKPSSGFSAQLLVDTVRLHPGKFVGLVVASLAVFGTVYALYPLPKNTVAVIFHLSGNSRVINLNGAEGGDIKSFQQVQTGLIKRRTVLLKALADPKYNAGNASFLLNHPNPVDWIEQNLKIDFKTGQQFMRVYLEGNQPEEMKALLNAIKDAYLAEIDQHDNATRIKKEEAIVKSIEAQMKEIQDYQAVIDNIAKKLNVIDERTLLIVENSLRDELNVARRKKEDSLRQMELAKREIPVALVDQLERSQYAKPKDFSAFLYDEPVIIKELIEEQIQTNPRVIEAERKVSLAKEQLSQLEAPLQKGTVNPQIMKAKQEIAAAETALSQITAEIRTNATKVAISREKLEQQKRLERKVDDIILLNRNYHDAVKLFENVEKELKDHNARRFDLEKQRKEIAHNEKTLAILRDELVRVQIEERAPKRVMVLEDPYIMAGVEGFKALRTSLVAGGGLFALGFGLLVFWENRYRRVNRTEDLSTLGLPILGTLPPHLESETGPNIELLEAVDSTRTLLLRAHSSDRSIRVLAVTSGIPGEGKTYLSCQLAISLARAGYRTLLVDGDVHAPRIHDVFKVQPAPGLCEVLRDEVPLGSSIQSSDVTGLFIMPAGNWTILARQYLVGDRWTTLRKDLESQYDFVVLDTAPLLMLTDTMLMALRVDGVILSVLAGISRMAPITQTKERLEALGVRVLGVVVNGVQARFPGYHYGPYANKYSARYQTAESAPLALTPAVDDRTEAKSP